MGVVYKCTYMDEDANILDNTSAPTPTLGGITQWLICDITSLMNDKIPIL